MKLNVNKIRFEIKRLGWSQAKLAKEAKITRQGLATILDRESTKLSTIGRLANALMVSEKDLLI